LESGACRPDITKDRIGKAIIENDTQNVITDVGVVATNGSSFSPFSPGGGDGVVGGTGPPYTVGVITTPAAPTNASQLGPTIKELESLLPSGILAHDTYDVPMLSNDAQFSNKLSCPLCPNRRSRFKSISALQDHLESTGEHSPKIYRYPGDDVSGKRFTTLGALTQHAEQRALEDEQAKKVLDETVFFVSERLKQLSALDENWSFVPE
jgi:hypothetical protein